MIREVGGDGSRATGFESGFCLPPDGRHRLDDVLAVLTQYFHDCP